MGDRANGNTQEIRYLLGIVQLCSLLGISVIIWGLVQIVRQTSNDNDLWGVGAAVLAIGAASLSLAIASFACLTAWIFGRRALWALLITIVAVVILTFIIAITMGKLDILMNKTTLLNLTAVEVVSVLIGWSMGYRSYLRRLNRIGNLPSPQGGNNG